MRSIIRGFFAVVGGIIVFLLIAPLVVRGFFGVVSSVTSKYGLGVTITLVLLVSFATCILKKAKKK